jgi:hypothetical protein
VQHVESNFPVLWHRYPGSFPVPAPLPSPNWGR